MWSIVHSSMHVLCGLMMLVTAISLAVVLAFVVQSVRPRRSPKAWYRDRREARRLRQSVNQYIRDKETA